MTTAHALPLAGARTSRAAPRVHSIRRDPRAFGRAPRRHLEPPRQRGWRLSDDVQLFAGTFAAGFVFVSILIS